MTLESLFNDSVVGVGQPLPDLLYATIDDLQLGLAAGTFTSVDLVKVW
jgi:amidase